MKYSIIRANEKTIRNKSAACFGSLHNDKWFVGGYKLMYHAVNFISTDVTRRYVDIILKDARFAKLNPKIRIMSKGVSVRTDMVGNYKSMLVYWYLARYIEEQPRVLILWNDLVTAGMEPWLALNIAQIYESYKTSEDQYIRQYWGKPISGYIKNNTELVRASGHIWLYPHQRLNPNPNWIDQMLASAEVNPIVDVQTYMSNLCSSSTDKDRLYRKNMDAALYVGNLQEVIKLTNEYFYVPPPPEEAQIPPKRRVRRVNSRAGSASTTI